MYGNSCISFFHASCSNGGLGIPSLAVESDVLVVSHVFKMTSSPDERVKRAAYNRLEWLTATKRKTTPSREDIATFLSDKPTGMDSTPASSFGASRDIIARVQRVSRCLGLEFGCVED